MRMAVDGTDAVVQVFFMREGKLIGRDHFHLTLGQGDGPAQLMSQLYQAVLCGNAVYSRECFFFSMKWRRGNRSSWSGG